ncbi:hypothetical protein GH741_14770 [Aquibacillus halophilus]|uniref:Uncharacterized protein n=1 Tax=Aquibacillus halophilus TaxID=930132 RepID=A0A6A8DE17_9BACI|nr:stage VI sporulation protein F [Aquibacillus halophilus]MRH43903.1 hypothetical protein [Aquibacillus halophilus]
MNRLLRQIGWKTGIPPTNMSDLLYRFQRTDFEDEYSARKFIKQATRQTGMPISRELEDMIVRKIIKRRR